MAWQGLLNRLVRGLLRTPLVCRVVGHRLITVYVVGRKSGRRYAIPVSYTRHDGILLVGTAFGWGHNLSSGEQVDIRYRGRRRPADVQVLTDESEVVAQYAVIARDNHRFATFNKIGLDPDGNPNPTDLHLAWAAGARVFQLTHGERSREDRPQPRPSDATRVAHVSIVGEGGDRFSAANLPTAMALVVGSVIGTGRSPCRRSLQPRLPITSDDLGRHRAGDNSGPAGCTEHATTAHGE